MRKLLVPLLLMGSIVIPAGVVHAVSAGSTDGIKGVNIPDEDRFAPFAKVIHVGDTIQWTNNDTDDHTVVSDDRFDTAGHLGTDQLVPAGGTFELTFSQAGEFVYYCRFHAHLDQYQQPVAPGPDGGIQGRGGNYGTPMSGVIIVLP